MSDLPPGARALVSSLAEAPGVPAKVLITGGVGTGKSSTLMAIRNTLRANGTGLCVTPDSAGAGGTPDGTAFVVDDADLLDDDDLARLTRCAADPGSTVVVACLPCEQRPGLRALMATLERERTRIRLGPLSRVEVARRHQGQDGQDAVAIDAIMTATAGLPFLVDAVDSAETADRSGHHALVDRLRRMDHLLLDAMLVLSLGEGLGPADAAAALGIDPAAAHLIVDRAFATGLLDAGLGTGFGDTVHSAAARVVGAARHHAVETALLTTQLEMSTLSVGLAVHLAEHGVRDSGLAGALEAAAGRDGVGPAEAARLYRGAESAGSHNVAIPLADALARAAHCAEAAVAADTLLTADDTASRAAGVRVAASVAAHDGNMAQAAELFSWLGPDGAPDAAAGSAAALALMATGDAAGARDALRVRDAGPPTSGARAARNLAEGLLLTLDHPIPVAMATLGQALQAPPAESATVDSPAAVVALAALHSGDAARARSVIGRAVHGTDAPEPLFDRRHRLIHAWLKMQDGQLQAATGDIGGIAESALHGRDALWMSALQTGVARRSGDTGALQHHWYAGLEVLADHPVDLFSLLPLGELWVAAARLRRLERVSHPVEQAFALLSRLGDPPAWSIPLHWAGVHAAILANAPESMAPHGQALTAAAARSGFARALAGAGRAWLRVLANQVALDEVVAAARGLGQYGLTWDATRLAGQAALQADDPRVSSTMLQVARDLKLSSGLEPDATPVPAEDGGARPPAVAAAPSGSLSEREREVAELLLLGMPYRDIGAQLFISAKTVEHHVARIRRRLGAESRSEMLSMLRAMLAPQT